MTLLWLLPPSRTRTPRSAAILPQPACPVIAWMRSQLSTRPRSDRCAVTSRCHDPETQRNWKNSAKAWHDQVRGRGEPTYGKIRFEQSSKAFVGKTRNGVKFAGSKRASIRAAK